MTLSQSPYSNNRLHSDEARLVIIRRHHGILQLDTQVHKLSNMPEYVAVSYVWGPLPASIAVPCNGQNLLVTPSAERMLQFLPLDKLYWIDAICINQDDIEEKATQIPLMQQLYSQAKIVVIWTGLSTPESHVFMCNLPRVLKTARNWTARMAEGVDPSTRADCIMPPQHDPFWVGLYQVLHTEWLKRLWTFQEVVFAKQSIVLSETAWIWPDHLIEFALEGRLKGYFNYTQEAVGFVCENYKDADDAIRELESIPKLRSALQQATQWYQPYLLCDLRQRRVKEPVDRIWAVAALLSSSNRKELACIVDYSATARAAYWKTYMAAFEILITNSQELQLLNIPPVMDCSPSRVPSWCRDISKTFACSLVFMEAWNYPVNHSCQFFHNQLKAESDDELKTLARREAIIKHEKKSFWFQNNGTELCIRGFVLETISEVVEDDRLRGREDYAEEPSTVRLFKHPLHAINMDWHVRGLALARRLACGNAETPDFPENYLMTLLADHRVKKDLHLECKETMARLINKTFGDHGPHRPKQGRSLIERFRSLAGHTFFATTSGRFGIAQPGCRPGDKVCVFYGGHPLYILRKSGDGKNHGAAHSDFRATFCGIAYLPHLMEPHQSNAARIESDEVFVLT